MGMMIKQSMTMGFKRGVFSNEAGLGSSVMVHSASNVKEPVVQGMWGIFEVFFDTIVVCTLTSFTVLSSGLIDLDTGEVFKLRHRRFPCKRGAVGGPWHSGRRIRGDCHLPVCLFYGSWLVLLRNKIL